MRTLTKAALIGGGLLGAWIGWGLYTKRSAERVPYEIEDRIDAVEIRRYPAAVVAETTARDQMTAFRRLFDYISGSNEGRRDISMTAPVQTTSGTSISMTAPVASSTSDTGDLTKMGFYLPPEFDLASAPQPTDADVNLREAPTRTLAVISFSWYAPNWRMEAYTDTLLETLERSEYTPIDEPVLFRYNDPWTPPFMRRNEVAVAVEQQ